MRFPVFRVQFPNGDTYYGVRPADTAESFRARIKTSATSGYTRLHRAARVMGTAETMQIKLLVEFDEAERAVLYANRLIDELAPEHRLNDRHLWHFPRRGGGGKPVTWQVRSRS